MPETVDLLAEFSPTITILTVAEWTVADINAVNWTFADVVPLLRDELWIAVRKRLERWKEWAMIGWKRIKNQK